MLFEQELDRVQRRAFGPFHPRLVVSFDKGADRFEIVRLVGIDLIFKTQQRFDGLPGGGVVRDVMQRARNITLAKPRVILWQAREGFGTGNGSHGCFHNSFFQVSLLYLACDRNRRANIIPVLKGTAHTRRNSLPPTLNTATFRPLFTSTRSADGNVRRSSASERQRTGRTTST